MGPVRAIMRITLALPGSFCRPPCRAAALAESHHKVYPRFSPGDLPPSQRVFSSMVFRNTCPPEFQFFRSDSRTAEHLFGVSGFDKCQGPKGSVGKYHVGRLPDFPGNSGSQVFKNQEKSAMSSSVQHQFPIGFLYLRRASSIRCGYFRFYRQPGARCGTPFCPEAVPGRRR